MSVTINTRSGPDVTVNLRSDDNEVIEIRQGPDLIWVDAATARTLGNVLAGMALAMDRGRRDD